MTWLLYAFVITSSYAACLRALLLRPRFTSPIETAEAMASSGLPSGMILYGLNMEYDVANSEDPHVQKFWAEKEVVQYTPFPFVEVRVCV